MRTRPTRFTGLVGCTEPIQSAAMGGVVTPQLAAEVALAGGLGMLAAPVVTEGGIDAQIDDAFGRVGDGVIGVGFLVPFLDRAEFARVAARVGLVECFYGDPDAGLVRTAHDGGALMSWQVGSTEEARVALDAGCDLIVVQGVEAGGHVRGNRPLDDLLAGIRPLTERPVVAAGGVGTPERARELFDAGADAVRIGSRFLATAEADVHPGYAAALYRATADDTVVTETFAAAWPDAPHRTLASCVEASADDPATRIPIPPTRGFTGDVAAAALYAGRSVDAVTGPTTVAEVMAEFVDAFDSDQSG